MFRSLLFATTLLLAAGLAACTSTQTTQTMGQDQNSASAQTQSWNSPAPYEGEHYDRPHFRDGD